MPTLNTTIGQLLINEALPSDMRDYSRIIDEKGSKQLFRELVEKHADEYRDVAKRLADVGRDAAFTTGGQSFGLRHLRPTSAVHAARARLGRRIRDILRHEEWSDEKRENAIIEATSEDQKRLSVELVDELKRNKNPLVDQVTSGARGNVAGLRRLLSGDGLYVDHRDNVIPFPVQTSFSEGLSPAEFWASTYGARKGTIDKKFATQDAGFLAKQLAQIAHRLIVVAPDADDDEDTGGMRAVRGYPVEVNDPDNEGTVLAHEVKGYSRNTVLTPKILKDLENKGVKRILIRSPIVGGPASGGVYGRDVGVRERGVISPNGDMVGLAAAAALSEKLTQGQLSSKHSGGVKGEASAVTGFQHVNQLVQTPKVFKGGATHARADGKVTAIDEAPAGGYFVTVAGTQHYVGPGFDLKVKRGDIVEAGDMLSGGIPNPAEIVEYKGIGEGRKYFVDAFLSAYKAGGMGANRRNVEILARGLINHVEMTEEDDDRLPGDVIPYQQLESTWQPRDGFKRLRNDEAVGKYLEKPVLHYTIGTQIRPSMLPVLKEFGVTELDTHDDPPPFRAHMLRGMASVGADPDWLVRFLGSNQKKGLLSGVHRGATSDTQSTSFVPALSQGVDFGKTWPQSVLRPPKT